LIDIYKRQQAANTSFIAGKANYTHAQGLAATQTEEIRSYNDTLNGFANNEYSIVLFGYFIGSMIARSAFYELMQSNKLASRSGILMALITSVYIAFMILGEQDRIEDFTLFHNMTLMFVFAIFFSLPAASIYSAVIVKILSPKEDYIPQNQKESAINWVLVFQDAGSMFAQIATAFLLLKYFPEVMNNPPG
jgi:hypothetical protein